MDFEAVILFFGVQLYLSEGFPFPFFFTWSVGEVCDGISNSGWWGRSDSNVD